MADSLRSPVGGAGTPRIDSGTLNRGTTPTPGPSGRGLNSGVTSAARNESPFSSAYKGYKEYRKWKERLESLDKLRDETTRSGEIFKISVDALKKGVAAILGVEEKTLSPYFAFYKPHITVIVALLDSDGRSAAAQRRLSEVAEIARNMRTEEEDFSKQYAVSENRDIKDLNIDVGMWQWYERAVVASTPSAADTPAVRVFRRNMEATFTRVEGSLIKILACSYRMEIEFDALERAYEDYLKKKQGMESGNPFDKLHARYDLEMAEVDAAIANRQDIVDPVGYAKGSVRTMEKLAADWVDSLDILTSGHQLPPRKG